MRFKSPTNIVMQNMIYDAPKPRKKLKPIPSAAEVTTYDPGYRLRKRKYDCMRMRRI